MAVTAKDVEKIAALARLELAPSEKTALTAELGRILGWIEKLGEVNTDGVEPTAHVLGFESVMRQDEPRDFADRELILNNAPAREFDFIKVKKVIG